MLRDRLQARLAEMGEAPDFVRLAEEVLGIRNATPALAERFVSQALVIEDRREIWLRTGAAIAARAPVTPGVYALKAGERTLYVGKAVNLKRRLHAHFAPRRWQSLPPALSRVTDAEWHEVGSELEALLLEADWIASLRPPVNVQTELPSLEDRLVPERSIRDLIVVVPSVEADSVELIAARAAGPTFIQRTRRDGTDLAVHSGRLGKFFRGRLRGDAPALAPIVYSWLAGRGTRATRIDEDLTSARLVRERLAAALKAEELFVERLVIRGGRARGRKRL